MTIGKRIKATREALNLTQEDVAKKVGVAIQTIYKYENEIVTNIPLSKLEKIAEALQTTPAYLMGWSDKPQNENKPGKAELEEDVVMYHRDGKTIRKKMSKETKAAITAMLDTLPDDNDSDL